MLHLYFSSKSNLISSKTLSIRTEGIIIKELKENENISYQIHFKNDSQSEEEKRELKTQLALLYIEFANCCLAFYKYKQVEKNLQIAQV
jgi:hypothetical protein